jgi:methyl-accepting chemotaxis protein
MRSINRLSLGYQFVGASVILAGLVILGLALFVSSYTYRLTLEQAQRELKGQVHSMRKMIDTTHEVSVGLTDKVSSILAANFSEPFALAAGRTVKIGAVETPALEYHGKTLNLDFAVVDEFTRTTGGVATLFARDGDDFVRVSTSLKNEAGERAIGTLLGKDHPARDRLLAGESYLGVAKLFGRQYMTKYTAAKDKDGKVVGVLFVGFDLSQAFVGLKEIVGDVKFGTTGYAFVFRTQGPEKGTMLFHPLLAGKNTGEIVDADGNQPFAKMTESPAGLITYPWKDERGAARVKLALYEQTDSLGGLVVVGGGYMEDFTGESTYLRNVILGASAVAALLLAALLYVFITRQLRPVANIVTALEQIGNGDLTARVNGTAGDTGTRNELHIIATSIDATAHHIGTLIAELRADALEVEQTAVMLSGTSANLASTAATQSDAASAMAAGVEEMAVSINHLSDNAQGTSETTLKTRQLAARGRDAANSVITQMATIAQTVADAATRIEQLGEASQRISSVVSVIKDVADQTNLLALNAAIEAARAGEQGRGFAVVADEVRKLAERTSVSTQEIAAVVESIQSGTGEAVRGMQLARERVSEGVGKVEASGATMSDIEAGASEVAAISADMSAALREQAAASNAIGEEVERISCLADENDASARHASQAAATLEQLSAKMSAAVGKFRTAA